jgi:hypothetical protein
MLSACAAGVEPSAPVATADEPLITLPGDVSADEHGADVVIEYVPQAQSRWCWAAVTEMVVRYFGSTIDQFDIVSSAFSLDCRNPENTIRCNAANDLTKPFQSAAGVEMTFHSHTISEAQLRHELTNARPVVMKIEWTDKGNHLMLISGYAIVSGIATYHVMDPLDGEQDATYDALIHFKSKTGMAKWSGTGISLHRN